MKNLNVRATAKSYGAFEMKEFIGKSTLKSFALTMGLMIMLPVVFIAVKASVNPLQPLLPPPVTVLYPPPEVHQTVPPRVEVPPPSSRAITQNTEGNYVPVDNQLPETTMNNEVAEISSQQVNGGDNTTRTIYTSQPSEVYVPSNAVEHDIDTDQIPETESDPILNYSQFSSNLVYPEVARRTGIEGKVLLRVVVGKDGKPVFGKVKVLDSTNDIFNQSAIDAVLKSTFAPAIQNGKPIEVPVVVPIVFRLH
jgi:protein TonB